MSESINMGIFFVPLQILSGNSIWRFKMKWRKEKKEQVARRLTNASPRVGSLRDLYAGGQSES